mmetsp:Transcript_8109/g.25805  ORF Transcript_8109/g.25805 Transcript_8109/m.25805 type:complete len:285 (-) Transcript_8109:239-1093(-)
MRQHVDALAIGEFSLCRQGPKACLGCGAVRSVRRKIHPLDEGGLQTRADGIVVHIGTLQMALTARSVFLTTVHDAAVEEDHQVPRLKLNAKGSLGRVADAVKLGPCTVVSLQMIDAPIEGRSRPVVERHPLHAAVRVQRQDWNLRPQVDIQLWVPILEGVWRLCQQGKSSGVLLPQCGGCRKAVRKDRRATGWCALQAVEQLDARERVPVGVVRVRRDAAVGRGQIVARGAKVEHVEDGPIVGRPDVADLVANHFHHARPKRYTAQEHDAVHGQRHCQTQLALL